MRTISILIAAAVILCAVGILIPTLGYAQVDVAGGTLYGKNLSVEKDAVVILVAGSGPTDLNGNSAYLEGRNDSLLQLATALKDNGISTIRYDKRGVGKSTPALVSQDVTFDLYVSDCVAWIRFAKAAGYQKIYVAGHSEGSLIAMLAAKQETVDGVISIAGAGFPIDIALERQLSAQFEPDSDEMKLIDALRSGEIYETSNDQNAIFIPTNQLFIPSNQRYILSWMEYDPAVVIASLDCPVLIAQGSEDSQVDFSEYNALKNARTDADTAMINGMNHVLKRVDGEKENADSYTNPALPIEQRLVDAIVSFVK